VIGDGMRVFKTKAFLRFSRKEGLSDEALLAAVAAAEVKPDADLGGGLIKQRVARPGQGKSGGYRTIIVFRRGRRAFFVFGFAKSDRSNISIVEEQALRRLAAALLSTTDDELGFLLERGEIVEVRSDERA
jgi:hypothetical protein